MGETAVEYYDSQMRRHTYNRWIWARNIEGLHCRHCGRPLTVWPIPGDNEDDEKLADAMYDLDICAECVLLGIAALAISKHGDVVENTRSPWGHSDRLFRLHAHEERVLNGQIKWFRAKRKRFGLLGHEKKSLRKLVERKQTSFVKARHAPRRAGSAEKSPDLPFSEPGLVG